jgi:predicted enzyme related to lactoylglutathione lyase
MERPAGHFCWINVVTPDPDADKAFYAHVLGWTFSEIPGMGWLVLVDGKPAGGVFPNVTGDGTTHHPGIGVMVRVDDAAAMAARMRALGGRASEPIPVGLGIMVDGADPEGAGIDLWQAGQGGAAQHDPMAEGAPFWFELLSRDVPRAVAFYHELFGWTAAAHPVGDPPYTVLSCNGEGIGGIMPVTPAMDNPPAFWGVYMHVAHVDAAVDRVRHAGGTVVLDAHDIPGVGRIAGVVSPQGVMFYLMAPAMPEGNAPAPPPAATA